MRDAVAQGWLLGPRLLISLRQLATTGGIGDHWTPSLGRVDFFDDPAMPDPVFDGADQARAAARRMLQAGADWLKLAATGSIMGPNAVHQEVTDEEIVALVDEANRRGGRQVMAHAHGARAAEAAARGGVRSIEHGIHLDEAAVAAMVDHRTWLVPTLSATMGETTPDAELVEAHQASLRMAIEAGVSIAMGTDCPVSPHAETLKEIGYLAATGLGAAGAVRAATYDAGRLLDLDIGEISPGSASRGLLRSDSGSW
ncbi:MAG: amidohydrolase family protein [Nocardioidaceae bacterium]